MPFVHPDSLRRCLTLRPLAIERFRISSAIFGYRGIVVDSLPVG